VEYTKTQVVETLRRLNRPDVAEVVEHMESLPERMDRAQCEALVAKYGVTMDQLISAMGGSP
jgi:hypothetical protein